MSFSDNVIKIFEEIGKQFGILADWSSTDILPYIEQLGSRIVQHELYTSIGWLILFIILLTISICLFKCIMLLEDCLDAELLMTIGAVLFIVATLGIIMQCSEIISCITLPEKIILEFLRSYRI